MKNVIAIIDFGGQYTHLIARRIRNLGIYSEIFNPEDFVVTEEIKGIIFSGGPQSVKAKDANSIEYSIKNSAVPLLGICYGHQLIAHIIGGVIEAGTNREYGSTTIHCSLNNAFFKGTQVEQTVWMSHGDHVKTLPEGYKTIASTSKIPVAAFISDNSKVFGVQFHPEVSHTEFGNQILDNFISVCVNQRDWKIDNYKEILIEQIKEKVKDKDVLVLLSGGVDSLVAMELCIAALGNDRVHAIHIDTGFMRYNESKMIIEHLNDLGYKNLELIQAQEQFLSALENVFDPEEKRLIIGRLFVEIANRALNRIHNKNLMLVQGTIYPDTIESGASDKSAKIKTHHNRVSEIEKLIKEGRIIEPIKDLYKDEVRKLGSALNIPEKLVNRHPFPGPGIAIRILVSNTENTIDIFRDENIKLSNLLNSDKIISKILPVRSVGVMGDFRTYHHPAVISYKAIKDHNWSELRCFANKAINDLPSVNRALYCIEHHKKEYYLKRHRITKTACDELRKIDHLLHQMIKDIKEIWQMPVVQLPLFDNSGKQLYVMRPVTSLDAMTADFYEMDLELLINIIMEAQKFSFVADLLYDITSKPPATIEWE